MGGSYDEATLEYIPGKGKKHLFKEFESHLDKSDENGPIDDQSETLTEAKKDKDTINLKGENEWSLTQTKE